MNGTTVASRLLGIANIALAVPVAYLGGLTAIAVVTSRRSRLPVNELEPVTRFVVLVPAHNEGTTIATMLASATTQDYPQNLFTVHVVADNCIDDTAATVVAGGATVHERHDTDNRGKGPALNWLVDRLVRDDVPFDVAVFIDADTTVEADFLSVLDRRFQSGSVAVQGFYGVREAFESVPATLRYCALAARHHCRPLARTTIGGSCGLFGNGMAFSHELIVSRSWSAHLVEDLEFQLELLLEGIHVDYEPAARLEAEMPHTFEASVTQHQRWEVGRFDLIRRFVPSLLARVARPGDTGRVAAVDAATDLCVPPLSLLGATTAASAGAGAMLALVSPHRTRPPLFGLAMLATVCIHVLASLSLVGAPRRAYRSLLHAPRLAVWKMSILLRSMLGKNSEWIRTTRNAEGAPRDSV